MCLESKDTDGAANSSDSSCWCLFRLSVLSENPAGGRGAVHRDSFGERRRRHLSAGNVLRRAAPFLLPSPVGAGRA